MRWFLALALAILVTLPSQVQAAAGDLDPTFGCETPGSCTGKVTTHFSGQFDDASAVAIQADGKIVAAGYSSGGNGDFALARYLPNGMLDPTFGTGGKVTTDFSGSFSNDGASAVAIQADGKIVAAGYSNYDFALARYLPNGTLDPTFGTGGKVTTDFSGESDEHDQAFAVAIQANGKIVAAGRAESSMNVHDFALARYLPNGTLDPTFGVEGKVITDFSGSANEGVHAVAIQADGKIVVAGSASSIDTVFVDFALARYLPNGTLDPTFGVGGKVTTNFSDSLDDEEAFDVAIQTDGKIVAAGWRETSSTADDFALARYLPNGTLDATFGCETPGSCTGKVTTNFSGTSDQSGSALAIQADGKIVVAGVTSTSSSTGVDFALVRYLPNGTLDTTFGTGGKVTTNFSGSSHDSAYTVAIQADGKIVAAGVTMIGIGRDFALARYEVPLEDQITGAVGLVQSFDLPAGTEVSLDAKLQNALSAANAGDLATACGLVGAFLKEVKAQTGKKISGSQAAQLTAAAIQLKTALGCP